MKKKYIIEVDESEIIEYWSEHGVKEIGYQEYALKSCPNIKVKPYDERPQDECCGCCYLCDVSDCGSDMQKGGAE